MKNTHEEVSLCMRLLNKRHPQISTALEYTLNRTLETWKIGTLENLTSAAAFFRVNMVILSTLRPFSELKILLQALSLSPEKIAIYLLYFQKICKVASHSQG